MIRILVPVLVAAALCTAHGTAHAQIYQWRDASGRLVLSDKPKDPAARPFPAGRTDAPRAIRAMPRQPTLFDSLIEAQASAHGISADLVRAVIQAESAYNPRATSPKGAMGLMQLMPATAQDYGVVDPYDPAENIRAGVAHLKKLIVRYPGNLELALAAYNAGVGAVTRYGTVPPYRETRDYVQKIRGAVDAAPPQAGVRIYRTLEYVNGRAVPRYSTVAKPGAEIVAATGRGPDLAPSR